MTPTLDKAYIHARRVSCIHPRNSLSEKISSNENTENNLFSCCASAEGKTVPCEACHIGFKGWMKILGNAPNEAVLLLSIKKDASPRAEGSVPPEMRHKQSVQRTSIRQGPDTFGFVLLRLLCAVSSSVSGLHFPKTVSFLCSVIIL